jgi:hypothetical protein
LPDDLLPDFRDRVLAFLTQLKHANARVSIGDTYRPPERAYLMHWCWMIAHGQDPASVPSMPGVDIQWSHGADSRAAAQVMVARYAIAYQPSLTTRHTQRRAIDMTIGWDGTLSIRDFDGQMHTISLPPRSGLNSALVAVGRSFGVIKLLTDPPHWSDDGH